MKNGKLTSLMLVSMKQSVFILHTYAVSYSYIIVGVGYLCYHAESEEEC